MERDCLRDLGVEGIILKCTFKQCEKICTKLYFIYMKCIQRPDNISDYTCISSNDLTKVNSELERMWTELAFA
jgi:hypothetical protein